jgi:hypothetical protein
MRHSHRTLKTNLYKCPETSERVCITREYIERGETRVRMGWQCSFAHGCTVVRATPLDRLQMELCPVSPWSKIDNSTDNQTAHKPHKT